MGKKNSMPTSVKEKDKFFVTQASKMSNGRVDIDNLRIDIKQGAEPSLADMMLKKDYGFQIQYVIDDNFKPIDKFNPEMRTHKYNNVSQKKDEFCNVGDRFKVVYMGKIAECVKISGKDYFFEYTDSAKQFPVSKEVILKNLRFKQWVKE